MATVEFSRLFEPINIGGMPIKNRIVMPPIGTNYAEDGGAIGQRAVDYYEARARGGVGLIIVEGSAPSMQSTMPHQASLGDDKLIPGWRKLTAAIHKYDARVAIQIMHSTMEHRDGKIVQVAPSPVVVPARFTGRPGSPPVELTGEEIGERVVWFASAARRAREAGFDGVEVHGAHQYLVAAFLSSATNRRQDRYGGPIKNKARFVVEILQSIRQEAGPDFPVWVRLNGREWGVEDGITIEETREVIPLLVEAGAQAIHVSGYGAGRFITTAPIADTPGALVPLAEEVKKVTDVPVIGVGRLDFELGEEFLEAGKADLIAIGRRLMTEPCLTRKMSEGRFDEVRPCIGCMECIERLLFAQWGEGVICVVNPMLGRENECRIEPAAEAKNVVVVGGGPAGLQAAIVAAHRGHRVTLFERELKLGGRLNIAARPPFKGDILPWIDYLTRETARAGVAVRLSTAADPETVVATNPDAVVIATGSIPAMPDIPGTDRPLVVMAEDVLSGKAETGQEVVIIGGGMVGCETGHYLAAQGNTVTILELLPRMANDMFYMTRRRLMDALRSHGVTMLTGVTCEEISEDGVSAITTEADRVSTGADTVVIATGYRPDERLYRALEGRVSELYCIGDSAEPRRIMEAVREGHRTGLTL